MAKLKIELINVKKVKEEGGKTKIYNILVFDLPFRKQEEEIRSIKSRYFGNIKKTTIC